MPPLPMDIRSLTSLRFLAAGWVLIYHFRDWAGLGLDRLGLVAHGWLGVDLFFLLSGFILTHVYLDAVAEGRFAYLQFLQNRLARIYPLHLISLLGMVGLVVLAGLVGAHLPQEAFAWSDLPQHLLLVHAWGTTAAVGWNFPSWSISAEWAAYLAFPLLLGAVLAVRQRPGLVVLLCLLACIGGYELLDTAHLRPGFGHLGQGFSQMTAQIGALRIMPTFTLGCALYVLVKDRPAPAWLGWPMALAGMFGVIVITQFALLTAWAWPCLALIVAGVAETARQGLDRPLAGPRLVALGAASYALYMLHLPVDIVAGQLADRAGIGPDSPLALKWISLLVVLSTCVALALAAHALVEEPARRAIRALPRPALPWRVKRAPG